MSLHPNTNNYNAYKWAPRTNAISLFISTEKKKKKKMFP